jgi:hypothetical protein
LIPGTFSLDRQKIGHSTYFLKLRDALSLGN